MPHFEERLEALNPGGSLNSRAAILGVDPNTYMFWPFEFSDSVLAIITERANVPLQTIRDEYAGFVTSERKRYANVYSKCLTELHDGPLSFPTDPEAIEAIRSGVEKLRPQRRDARVQGLLSQKWPKAQAFLDIAILSGYTVAETPDAGLTLRKNPDDGTVATVMLSLGVPNDMDPGAHYLTVSPFEGKTEHVRLGVPHADHILKFIEGGYET